MPSVLINLRDLTDGYSRPLSLIKAYKRYHDIKITLQLSMQSQRLIFKNLCVTVIQMLSILHNKLN